MTKARKEQHVLSCVTYPVLFYSSERYICSQFLITHDWVILCHRLQMSALMQRELIPSAVQIWYINARISLCWELKLLLPGLKLRNSVSLKVYYLDMP